MSGYYIPLPKRTTPNPQSPNFGVHLPPVGTAIAASADRPSRTERREQIADQLEEQINRQADPKEKIGVPWIQQSIHTEIPQEWSSVRAVNAPRNLIAQDGYNRAKGWERGKRDEKYFQKNYRHDYEILPYLAWNYKTPNNSKVSDKPHWRSRDWLREVPTKRQKNLSKLKGVVDNPKLVAALKKAAEEVSQDDKFLQISHPVLGTFWRGVKVLGRGGQGVVGLWEYTGPGKHIWGKRIVIKQSLRYPLNEEREMMMKLDDGSDKVNHVVQLLYPMVVDHDKTPQLYKIILEFCEGGDLDSLIIKQRKSEEPFSEKNLWLFFECFAKGLNLMDHGNESPDRKPDSRDPMCHFDIKPMNILRGQFDGEHKFNMPINKIADFGLAACIDPTHYAHFSRRRGTEGHLAPEQFSGRWAFRDAERCGHINVWGTHTNIWQIGIVMYMLATLRGPPRPRGFRCSAIGKKFTYGYKLHREKYSKALKSLIWRCLCDKPKDRPDLLTIHKEIASALRAISRFPFAAGSEQQLEPPEPQPPKEPPKGPPPDKGIEIPLADKTTRARSTKQRPKDAATGARAAPFIVPGTTKVLRKRAFSFCVVPKYLPQGKQEPIWLRAYPDSRVMDLKKVIREDAGLNLVNDTQFIYMRIPDQPVLLLENMARMLSLYGVGQDFRLELWIDREAHDAAEPDESEFEVL